MAETTAGIRTFRGEDREQVLALAPRLTEGVAPWRDPAAGGQRRGQGHCSPAGLSPRPARDANPDGEQLRAIALTACPVSWPAPAWTATLGWRISGNGAI